jgi:tRNA G18 (ribose-2'-O)-methylase SpoU
MSEDLVASLSGAEASQGLLALAEPPVFEEEALFSRGASAPAHIAAPTAPRAGATPPAHAAPAATAEAAAHAAPPASALVLVADAVQNPGNLGGLLRTAEAAGATGVFLTAGCADPFSWKALRGSMGSAFRLPQRRGLSLAEVLERLRARGVAVLAAAADGELRYDEADLRRPTALLVGNEGAGLSPSALAAADARLRIPIAPHVESLNVAVAAALVLYEAARQRGFPGVGAGH